MRPFTKRGFSVTEIKPFHDFMEPPQPELRDRNHFSYQTRDSLVCMASTRCSFPHAARQGRGIRVVAIKIECPGEVGVNGNVFKSDSYNVTDGERQMNIAEPGLYMDHMLRTTRMHHVHLSSMADVKASMLLTIASVIITLTVGYLLKPGLMWPAMVLIFFCLVTIVLAAYAVMPKMPFRIKAGSPPDVDSPFFNILFFGDFVRMEYEEFEGVMEETLNDHRLSYQAMVQELYTLGVFLATKKYRLIRLAYISFIVGLIASCFTFLFVNIPV